MGRRDKVDPIEALRWQQYNASPTIAEKYPNVAALSIDMVFHDDSGMKVIDNSTSHYPVTESKTLVNVKCPNRECVRGGFDLSQIVASTIQKGQQKEEGRVVCQGWQDQERVGKFHCLCDLVYEIRVEYKTNS